MRADSLLIIIFLNHIDIVSAGELPYHEWFIEFDTFPQDTNKFKKILDISLQKQNPYYSDLRKGSVIQELKITTVDRGGFSRYMQSKADFDPQCKLARLSDNRDIADFLLTKI